MRLSPLKQGTAVVVAMTLVTSSKWHNRDKNKWTKCSVEPRTC
jgi:hypothetical protein